ncbi:MAG: DUF5615 family PIN-like protein [Bryobacteraceae bacterium]
MKGALRNGLARVGDRRILEYATAHDFILVSTDSDFERLLKQRLWCQGRHSPFLRLSN